MKKYKVLASVLFSLVVLVSGVQTTVFADPGEGNTRGTINLLTPANAGQEMFFTLSPSSRNEGSNKDGNQFKVRFTDETAKDQRSTPQPVNVKPSSQPGEYQFKMPTDLAQGDTYDITVTLNGMTYEGTFVAPLNNGDQLPETRYAVLLPIMLLAVLGLSRRRQRRVGQN